MSRKGQQKVPRGESLTESFTVDVTGGDGYRILRNGEKEQLRTSLNRFSDESTKISPQEIEFKKDLVKWLVKRLKKDLGGFLCQTFNTGSAYEKLQAGEAKDFDIMIFLNVRKWAWVVHSDPEKPEFCWITRGVKRKRDNPNSFTHLLDEDGRLSSLKVRKFFTSKIDKFLRKNNSVEFEHAPITSSASPEDSELPEKEHFKVEITRKYQGPATTLMVECKGITPFTIDLVSSLHVYHIKPLEKCDFVAKPYDKQKMFGKEYEHMWRRSYSRQESKKMKLIDGGNRVHRKLLRIFKILRKNQPQLKLLKTYIFKNLLLFMSDLKGKEWKEENITDRFVDMVIGLRNCLANQKLPVYFNRRINLLQESEYPQEKIGHVSAYLRRIANKGIEGYESLLAAAKEDNAAKAEPLEEGGQMVAGELTEESRFDSILTMGSQPPSQQAQGELVRVSPAKKTEHASLKTNKKKQHNSPDTANSQTDRPNTGTRNPNQTSQRNRNTQSQSPQTNARRPAATGTSLDLFSSFTDDGLRSFLTDNLPQLIERLKMNQNQF